MKHKQSKEPLIETRSAAGALGATPEAAQHVIEETEVISLSLEGQRQIAEMLTNPPPPNAAMKRALRAHRELFGGE